MPARKLLSNLGIPVYGFGAIAQGLAIFFWGDFATEWWPIQALPFELPHRAAFAYAIAACLILAGAAALWPRTAQPGIAALTILYFIPSALWLHRVIGFPRIFGTWGGFLQDFSLVAAGLVAYASLQPPDSPRAVRITRIALFLYAICVISYGLVHFLGLSATASMVPKWIPPSQMFWAIATGVFDLLAAFAILTGIFDVLASRLLTAMLLGFSFLIWMPLMFTDPHEHIVWGGNAVNLAFVGAAWAVADAIARRRKQIQNQQDATPASA